MSPCVLCVLPCLAPYGGDEEIRTLDPLLAGQVLSQLSYTPGSFQGSRTLKIEQRNSSFKLSRPVFLSMPYCEMASFVSISSHDLDSFGILVLSP